MNALHRKLIGFLFVSLAVLPRLAFAGAPATQPNPIASIVISPVTEEKLGAFPYDRSVLAKAIRRLDACGPRAIVIKYFLDQPKSREGDTDLADALRSCRSKIILQAKIDDTEPAANDWPDRYDVRLTAAPRDLLAGDSGWLPLPHLTASAYDIGFANVRDVKHVPTVLKYRGHNVKSLVTSVLEATFDEVAVIQPGESLKLGPYAIPLDARGEIEIDWKQLNLKDRTMTNAFSEFDREWEFVEFLEGRLKPEHFRDRVVMFTYDGMATPIVNTPNGEMGIHTCFRLQLFAAYQQLVRSR